MMTDLDLNMDSHLISISVLGQQGNNNGRKDDSRCNWMIKSAKNPNKTATQTLAVIYDSITCLINQNKTEAMMVPTRSQDLQKAMKNVLSI